jgi:3-oxoacyl-[acyl-carrier-protein] synthase-3
MSCKLEHIEIEALSFCTPDTPGDAAENEQTASDLAFQAALKILRTVNIVSEEIGAIIFLSSTPDYRSPATAMVLQKRLNLPLDLIAFDVNSSGNAFNQGIQIGHSLLNSSNSRYVLILYGETPSKRINFNDKESESLKDYGAAILIGTSESGKLMELDFFTNSKLWDAILVKGGGYKNAKPQGEELPYSNLNDPGTLHLDKKRIENFQIQAFENFDVLSKIKTTGIYFLSNFKFKLLAEFCSNSFTEEFLKSDLSSKYGGATPQIQLQDLINTSKEQKINVLSLNFGEGLVASCLSFEIRNNILNFNLKSNLAYLEGDISHDL